MMAELANGRWARQEDAPVIGFAHVAHDVEVFGI
jgi:hypothetical protein